MRLLIIMALALTPLASSTYAQSLITPDSDHVDGLLCGRWHGKFDDATADIHIGNTTHKTRLRLCRRSEARSQIDVEGRDSDGMTVLSKANIFTDGCVDVWGKNFYLTKVPLQEEMVLHATEAKCFEYADGGWQSGGYKFDQHSPEKQTIIDLETSSRTKICLNSTHALKLNVKVSHADPGTAKTIEVQGRGFFCETFEAQRLEITGLASNLPGESYYIWYGDCLLDRATCGK